MNPPLRTRHGFLLAMGICLSFALLAQQQAPTTPAQQALIDLSSPRACIVTHLRFLQEDHYDEALAAEALFGEKDKPKETRVALARKLKEIYDGAGYYVNPDDIPNDPNYTDSMGMARYIVFPQYPALYVQKYGDHWLYAEYSLKQVSQIHKTIYPYGADLLVGLVPGSIGQKKALGLRIWQWLGILLLMTMAYLVYRLTKWVLAWAIKRLVPVLFRPVSLEVSYVQPAARPLALLCVLVLLSQLLPSLQLPITWSRYVVLGLKLLLSIAGIWVAYRVVDMMAAIFTKLTARTETTMDDQLVPLLSKIAKTLVVVFGLMFILQNLDVNVTALLAGISIGGLALALAAQDTVKNFIGSISIFWDRPFQIGDFIETADFSGTVEEVGVRTTRLREPGGALVSIPNGTIANMSITNHSMRSYRRYATTLTVTYGTSTEQIDALTAAIKALILDHPSTRKSDFMVQFHQMSDSSLDIFMAVFFELTGYEDFLKARHSLLSQIMQKAQELGVGFAFPSTSLYIEQMPYITGQEGDSA